MSLEFRVEKLESSHQNLDHAVRGLIKIVGGTHEVVILILKEQMEFRKQVEHRFVEVYRRFDHQDKRFDKIVETLVQIVSLLSK